MKIFLYRYNLLSIAKYKAFMRFRCNERHIQSQKKKKKMKDSSRMCALSHSIMINYKKATTLTHAHKIILTKSASVTVIRMGLPLESTTLVPMGAFSSTEPSMAVE